MRMLGIMGIGLGLIFALVVHVFAHILPICLLAGFIILGTRPGFCNQKPHVEESVKSSGSWFRTRGGC